MGSEYEIDWADLDAAPSPDRESDEQLRERLRYTSGDSPAEIRLIEAASSSELDDLAARRGLRRRGH